STTDIYTRPLHDALPISVMSTNITQLAIDLATLARGRGDPNILARARRRASMTFPCVVAFVAGCAAGAVLEVYFGLWALALPVRSEEHTSELQSPDHLVC